MVDALPGARRKENDWGFHEEPPPPGLVTGSTGRPQARGFNDGPSLGARAPVYRPLLPDLTVFLASNQATKRAPTAPSPFDEATGASRSFSDTASLGPEIFRLKASLREPSHDEATRAAIRQQIVMRQAEWVTKAKAEGLREPTGPLDPFKAKPSEIENAFLWSEAGGVVPRDELAKDGGRAFQESVRDAVVLRVRGFDAVLALHEGHPQEQRGLLVRELALRGVRLPDGDKDLDTLRALRGQSIRNEESYRVTIGLDGRIGNAEVIDGYERDQALAAMNPGSTLGSMMATYSTLATGHVDIERIRAMGNAGNALEGVAGGVGLHLNRVAAERTPTGNVKPNVDTFNREGLRPRFKLTPMDPHYADENQPGNNVWNRNLPTKPLAVKYAERPTDRAPFKLEARPVTIGGKTEMRLFDASGKLFDTRDASAHDGEARAIFVMNAHGEIFSSTYQEAAYVHHSSLSGGAPVAAAGELVVVSGKVVGITNRSGHYRPGPAFTEQLITSLRAQGLDLAGVEVATYGGSDPFAPDVRVLR